MEALQGAAIGNASPLGDPPLSEIQKMESERRLCGICDAIVVERGLLDCCDHMFCFSCIEDWATVTNLCPMCKAQFKFLTFLATNDEAIQGRNENSFVETRVAEEAFSYFIDEEAIACLDGDDCKLRMQALQTAFVDTSVACDKCDRWYHACCVGFDPGKPNERTWLCPRCALPNEAVADEQKETVTEKSAKHEEVAASMSFAFMETGESAIVISMVGGKEGNAQAEPSSLPPSSSLPEPQEHTSLDKLLEDLGKQNASVHNDEEGQELEEFEEEQEFKHDEKDVEEEFGNFGEEQQLEDFGFEDAEEEQELEFVEEQQQGQEVEDSEQRDEEPCQDFQVEPQVSIDREDVGQELAGPATDFVPSETLQNVTSEADVEMKIEELVSDDDSDVKLRHQVVKGRAVAEDSSEKQNQTDGKGVRTRIIMRRDVDDQSLAEKIRRQVVEAAGGDGAQVSNENLLAAYKAAIVKRDGPKQKKAVDTARKNLKRKLYGGIRGRQVYDRDWDVAFWRDKVLGDKRRKPEQEEAENTESTPQQADSILDRLCFADCSLLPKKEGFRPPPVTEDKPRPKPTLHQASKTLEVKTEVPVDGNAEKDKKQWALELLARKNKQQVRSTHDTLKGNFVHLPKLPIDMRPSIEPNPRSKIPSAVRQIQLNRLTDHYLKKVKIGRNQASEDAVNAALSKEAEIFLRSNSKGVYVNLCARALAQGDAPPAKANVETNKDVVAEALVAAGLVSDSPPGSPLPQEEAAAQPGAQPAADVIEAPEAQEPSRGTEVLTNPGSGKQGITALLEHLRKEEEPELPGLEPVCTPSESKQEKADVKSESLHVPEGGSNAADAPESDSNATDATVSAKQEDTTALTNEETVKEKEEEKQNPCKVADSEKDIEKSPVDHKEGVKNQENAKVEAIKPEQDATATKAHADKRADRSSRKHPRDPARPDRHAARKKEKVGPEDPMSDEKFSELDSRIDRVRSSIAQQFGENSDIAQQIRESSGSQAPKPRKPAPDHPRKHQRSSPSVQEQVEMYVKEHIRPLYKSGVIMAEQYQWTVSKTTAKVMQHHKDAPSAEFLISEGGRVKKLAEQYLQRFAQEKKESKK
ncbi:uncharacterized protein At4g10930 isoform X1 [Selaginella moellendorffii]|uniref:uncharacterized protein At4g10930 isoform X1 n=1 Tax=Selaginella moellendorffii TaxID=88036 RepID=UPI000D1C59CB|nr:uncharacterized protein At4g10930 isoform X1 [Selaginella moellendorffii]|eukprot:XP_024534861.1 uncharacterized protein At4g10930 isoform X1 [Selaginella moellendorffii]